MRTRSHTFTSKIQHWCGSEPNTGNSGTDVPGEPVCSKTASSGFLPPEQAGRVMASPGVDGGATFVGFHYPCPDGVFAAYACSLGLQEEPTWLPLTVFASTASRLELCKRFTKHDTLYLVDFSGGVEFIAAACKAAKRVVVIDHHKTAAEDLASEVPLNALERLAADSGFAPRCAAPFVLCTGRVAPHGYGSIHDPPARLHARPRRPWLLRRTWRPCSTWTRAGRRWLATTSS